MRAQLAAIEKIVDSNKETLAILRNQLKLGYVSGMEVAAQESALASAEQSAIPLRKQLEQTRDLIRALAGNFPDQDVEEKFELAGCICLQELPLSLPSRIVEQRPDVRAAEEQLHFASAQAGVAIANTLAAISHHRRSGRHGLRSGLDVPQRRRIFRSDRECRLHDL